MGSDRTHLCFVDEAGDEGHARGTRWFVVAGVVAHVADVTRVADAVSQMKADVKSQPQQALHFRNLNHVNRKHVAASLGRMAEATVIAVASDTYAIPEPKGPRLYRPRNWLYHYMTRYLLERVAMVAGYDATVDVYMSNKGTLRYEHLEEYLRRVQQDDAKLKRIRALKPQQPTQSLGIQLADVAASSIFFAFEPDRFGRREEDYIRALAPRLWRQGMTLVGNGIKLMGTTAVQAEYVAGECSWLRTL